LAFQPKYYEGWLPALGQVASYLASQHLYSSTSCHLRSAAPTPKSGGKYTRIGESFFLTGLNLALVNISLIFDPSIANNVYFFPGGITYSFLFPFLKIPVFDKAVSLFYPDAVFTALPVMY